MCQKVHNRVLLLSNAIIITVIWDLILNLGSSLNEISAFLLLLFFLLICCLFNSISLEYSRQWNETSSNQKRKKKITLFFSLPARPCSHRPCARGRKDILAPYFFAEELFVSMISVKFAIRRSLLQPSFRVLFYSFSGASLLFEFRRVGEDPGNEVVFTAESNIKPSCNRVTNLVKYYPILQKTAIGQ